jgi:drug/metabolite transporter (DMT)-like permease
MQQEVKRAMGGVEWLLLLILAVIWGGSFFFNKISLHDLRPFTVVFARVALAAVTLNVIIMLKRQPLRAFARYWPAFLMMGAINNFIPFSLLTWGQTRIASGLAAILNATTPLFTVVLAHLLTRDERVTVKKLIGVLCGIAGVVFIIGPQVLHGAGGAVAAEVACLGAALSYALAGIYGRRFKGLPSLVAASGQVTATALMALPVEIIADRPWQLAAPGLATWGSIAALGLLSTAAAYVIYFRILSVAGATNVVLVTFLVPLSALLLGSTFLRERLELRQLVGMACIGLGLAIMDGRPLQFVQARLTSRASAIMPSPVPEPLGDRIAGAAGSDCIASSGGPPAE